MHRNAKTLEGETAFRRHLVESVVAYVNNEKSSREAFGWVPARQVAVAEKLFLRTTWARFVWDDHPDQSIDGLVDSPPRVAFRLAVDMLCRQHHPKVYRPIRGATHSGTVWFKQFLSEWIEPLEIVARWHVQDDGTWDFLQVPRLDSPARCVAYAISLLLLNTDELGRAVKPCVFITKRPKDEFEKHPHYFVNLPVTRRNSCPMTGHGNNYQAQKHSAPLKKSRTRKGSNRK